MHIEGYLEVAKVLVIVVSWCQLIPEVQKYLVLMEGVGCVVANGRRS